jgi:hypothetical protein
MENGKKHEQYEKLPISNDFSSPQSIAIPSVNTSEEKIIL